MLDGRGATLTAAAFGVAGLWLGLAAASGPLFVSSAGSAMLDDELDAVGDGLAMFSVSTSGSFSVDELRDADRHLAATLNDHGLPGASEQLVIEATTATEGGRLNLIARDEAAMDQLPPPVDRAPGEVAVTTGSAASLDVDAGGELLLHSPTRSEPVSVPIGSVVEEFDRNDMPSAWRPVTGLLTAVDDVRIPPPPPALLMHTSTALELLAALGHEVDEQGIVTSSPVQARWSLEAPTALTIEQAQHLVPQLDAVRRQVADPTTEVGQAFAPAVWGPPSLGGAQFDAAVDRVSAAVERTAIPVRLLGIAGQVLALGGVAAATVLAGQRRLSRARLWTVRGVPVPLLSLRWAAGAAPGLVAGLALGRWTAVAVTSWVGPGGAADAQVRHGLWAPLAVAGGIALATVAIVAAIAIRAHLRVDATPQRIPPVAELLVVAAAALAFWQADTREVVVLAADGTLQLDPLAVALPVLLVVAAAALGARLLGMLLRTLGRLPARRPAWFLASRRLGSFGGASMALTFLTASAFGLFVLASTLHTSSTATVDEKAGLTAGADAVLELSRSSVSDRPDPSSLPTPATMVRRAPEVALDDGTTVDVLAIDPGTFADVAYEPQYLADLDLADLTSRLATSSPRGALPTISVGLALDRVASVEIGQVHLDVEEVGRVPVFPGATGERPTLVVADAGPLRPEDPAGVARLAIAVFPELWVAQDGLDDGAFRSALAQVEPAYTGTGPGASTPSGFALTADRRHDPGIAPATSTFSFLRAQATVVAALGLLALLAHHLVVQRRQALGTDLATRMGLRRRDRVGIELTQLAGLTSVAALVGVVSGLAAARAVVTDYDPLPDVSLPVVFRLPLEVMTTPLGIAVGAVLVAAFATIRAVDHLDVASVLRSGG